MELDLTRPRDLSEILATCFRLYGRWFQVFAAIALVVVVPADVVTLGFVEGLLTDYDGEYAFGGGPAYTICQYLLVIPLITAGHVSAVMQLGAGERPSIGASLGKAGTVLLPLMATVVLAGLGALIGLVFLIVPGVFLYVRWYVAAQSVVVEDNGPIGALKHSWELVDGQWWRVFGISIVIALLGAMLSLLGGVPVSILAALVESGPLLVVGSILFDAIALSFVALGGTILFFDLKVRKQPYAPAFVAPDPSGRPEAPF